MTWIFLVLSSHFFWAIENTVTKYAVDKHVKNPYIFLILFSLLQLIAVLLIPFIDFFVPSWQLLALMALAGSLYFFGGLPYIKAMQMEEMTRINILWGLIPVFSLFFGYFIGDYLSSKEIIAFILLIIGSILSSVHFETKQWRFSKAFWLMLVACLGYSLYGVLLRYVGQIIPFLVMFVWVMIFNGLAALVPLFLPTMRKDFRDTLNIKDSKFRIALIVVVIFSMLGGVFNQWALSLKQAALVFSLEGFQIFFVFIIAILLTKFAPKVIKEQFDRKNLLLKLVALVLMIVGIVVLNV